MQKNDSKEMQAIYEKLMKKFSFKMRKKSSKIVGNKVKNLEEVCKSAKNLQKSDEKY